MATLTFDSAPAQTLLKARAARNDLSVLELAETLRVPRRTLLRVLSRPRLRWDTADRIAIALGYHPIELWPHWHDTTEETRT